MKHINRYWKVIKKIEGGYGLNLRYFSGYA